MNYTNFETWWEKSKCTKRVEDFESDWLKDNEPNEEEEGGDYWHVNQMVHDGEAFEMTYEHAETVFNRVLNEGKEGQPGQMDSLYCELDDIIWDAGDAALKLYNKR